MKKNTHRHPNTVQRLRALLCLSVCAFAVSSCVDGNFDPLHPYDSKKNDRIDPGAGLSREDYRNLNNPEALIGGGIDVSEPPVPDLAEIIAAPKPPKIGETQLVSVAVTDDIPLKDVIIELARLADVDVEVDAGISGGISFTAKDRPFNEVIDRISNMAGLRYTMKGNILRVERDAPYIEVYNLDFLNMDRSSGSNMNINTSVLSSSGAGSGGGAGGGGGGSGGGGGGSAVGSGSDTKISSKTESDFWKKFEEAVKNILAYEAPNRVSSVTVAAQPANPQVPQTSAPQPQQMAAPAMQPAAAAPAAAAASANFFTLNRQAGTLTVSASSRQHELLREFIRRVQKNATLQVLIEAKIVEVNLNDEYQGGINWSRFGTPGTNLTADYSTPITVQGGSATPTFATLNLGSDNIVGAFGLDAAVKMVEIFGTTRTLSSPRLHALNNQQAVLTFAKNQVYYTIEVEQTTTTATSGSPTTNITVDATANTVPIGIILSLQPSINSDTSEVTLNIRPTLSRIVEFVDDPSIVYLLSTLDPVPAGLNTKQAPIVEVRELDSILKLKSGQVMVIGGLMEDKSANADQGVPGVSGVPWVGNLFKSSTKAHNMTELVIFIKATIVGSSGDADRADKAIYEKFTKDPRPLKF